MYCYNHLGFGRSDKPTDIHWYTIARHTEVLASLVMALDLKNVTLVFKIGVVNKLTQAASMPGRFDRLVIMNTWLHHDGYSYCDNVKLGRRLER